MKQIFQRFAAVIMAVLLLFSTTSWKVEKHYCMGSLIDVSLFVDADTCGMQMPDSVAENVLNDGEKSCCADEIVFFDGQDQLKVSFNDLDISQQVFLVAYVHSYITLFTISEELPFPNEYYPPPILVKDIQLLDEVFLI